MSPTISPRQSSSGLQVPPYHLSKRILFHLGYHLPQQIHHLQHLQHVRYIILCGSARRATHICSFFNPNHLEDICRTDRYNLYNPRPEVLVAAHGIGTGSIDVLLHELYIALNAVGAIDFFFIRVGTCGGIGVPPGTLVITNNPLNGALRPTLGLFILGNQVNLPARLDDVLSSQLYKEGMSRYGNSCIRGDTLCAETFHLAQGRFDGAFVEYGQADRKQFFQRCRDQGVKNIEMESLPLAAFTTRMGIRTAVVCAVLVDRLRHETPVDEEAILHEFQERAIHTVVGFVLSSIEKMQNNA